ncbi:hypothetical protein [Stenotrophomonas pigmentata]|uniref:hypothetical protein n=1 Tax=Stenotrophomonas pigmentata TaxID=3055080 RepID=UPI0026F1BA6C|nr:hypothetical protein [Stenotrophomonas sp. 610A2]
MNYSVWIFVGLSAGVAACATQPPPAPNDPVQCTNTLPARIVKMVYVDVMAGPSGPVVSPDECVVRSGTIVLWRTPENVLDPFELAFAESPVDAATHRMSANGAPKDFRSQRMGRRQGVEITAKEVTVENRIKYDVRIGSSHLDPGIKIMPR